MLYKSFTFAFMERRISVEVLGEMSGIGLPDLHIFRMCWKSERVLWYSGEEWMLDISGDLRDERLAKNPSGTDSPA